MATIKFTIAKTSTGFDAYYEKNEQIVAITTGSTIKELKDNALEAYNLYAEESGKKSITLDQISLQFDLPAFFEYYPVSAKALSSRVGINSTLLSQYVNGLKKPSARQIQRILEGVKQVGKELSEMELI